MKEVNNFMKIIYALFISNIMILNAQNVEQIKKQLEASGISNQEARKMAKDKGFSDEQIDAELRLRGNDLNASEQINQDMMNLSPKQFFHIKNHHKDRFCRLF